MDTMTFSLVEGLDIAVNTRTLSMCVVPPGNYAAILIRILQP